MNFSTFHLHQCVDAQIDGLSVCGHSSCISIITPVESSRVTAHICPKASGLDNYHSSLCDCQQLNNDVHFCMLYSTFLNFKMISKVLWVGIVL